MLGDPAGTECYGFLRARGAGLFSFVKFTLSSMAHLSSTVLDVYLESVDFSIIEESKYYEWLSQDLTLKNVGDPMAFAEPVETSPIF